MTRRWVVREQGGGGGGGGVLETDGVREGMGVEVMGYKECVSVYVRGRAGLEDILPLQHFITFSFLSTLS